MPIPADVEEATLVHISVKKDGPDYVLHVFPGRPGDTVAFYSKNPGKKSPERPHKVVWVGHGLTDPSMKIVISEKAGLPAADAGTLAGGYVLTQAAPKAEDSTKHSGTWKYNIELFDATTQPQPRASLDPDVIVHNDP